MLDINIEKLRQGFWSYLPVGATVALLLVAEMALVLTGPVVRAGSCAAADVRARGLQQYQGTGPTAVYRLRLSV